MNIYTCCTKELQTKYTVDKTKSSVFPRQQGLSQSYKTLFKGPRGNEREEQCLEYLQFNYYMASPSIPSSPPQNSTSHFPVQVSVRRPMSSFCFGQRFRCLSLTPLLKTSAALKMPRLLQNNPVSNKHKPHALSSTTDNIDERTLMTHQSMWWPKHLLIY